MIRYFYEHLPAKLVGTKLRADTISDKELSLLIKVLESDMLTQLDKYQTCQAIIAAIIHTEHKLL